LQLLLRIWLLKEVRALNKQFSFCRARGCASRYHGVNGDEPIDWTKPELNRRAVCEYLAALDPTRPPERKTPKVISLSDPCSAWTAKAHKRVHRICTQPYD
jgi:hypothetical protein